MKGESATNVQLPQEMIHIVGLPGFGVHLRVLAKMLVVLALEGNLATSAAS